jgi:hypothetical protein
LSASGDDKSCQAYTIAQVGDPMHPSISVAPCRSISTARNFVRDEKPDWMLFNRGDTFEDSFSDDGNHKWITSGRSYSEPQVITAYGKGARPILNTGVKNGFTRSGGNGSPPSLDNIVIMSLDFVSGNVGNGGDGIYSLGPVKNFLIEDTRFLGFSGGLIVQSSGVDVYNVTLRRSVIADSWMSGSQHAQGIFADGVQGLLVQENVLDHNGWLDSLGNDNAQNHNMYLSDNFLNHVIAGRIVVTGNIIARASSFGTQARPGGRIESNLFLENPLAGYTAGIGPNSIINNVVLGSRVTSHSSDEPASGGVGLSTDRGTVASLVEGNIIAHYSNSEVAIDQAYGLDTGGPIKDGPVFPDRIDNIAFKNNIAYDWQGSSLLFDRDGSRYYNVTIEDNIFQGANKNNIMVTHVAVPELDSLLTYRNNIYYSPRSISQWFSVAGSSLSFDSWQSEYEPTAINKQITFVDPDRDMSTYMASLGYGSDKQNLNSFLSEAREQSKDNWRPQLTTEVAAQYIRDGFVLQGSLADHSRGGSNEHDFSDLAQSDLVEKLLKSFKTSPASHASNDSIQEPSSNTSGLLPLVGRVIDSSYEHNYSDSRVYSALLVILLVIAVAYIVRYSLSLNV